MHKLFFTWCLMLCLSLVVLSQSSSEYNKNEFYVGYSNQQVDNGQRNTYNGFEGSYVRNIHRYVGVKADFSAAFRKDKFTTLPLQPNSEVKRTIFNILGGIQIKDNASNKKLQPFAHILVGVANGRGKVTYPASAIPTTKFSDTGISGAFGGGLDIKINEKVNFRAIQVDYNPMKIYNFTNHNIRFGIGFVFK